MGRQVRFDVPVEVAFDYLVDPHNRPAWQSSLRNVESVNGEPRVGQRWIDVTVPGLRPLMETTALNRPHRWTEIGTWHGIDAELTLDFAPDRTGCLVLPTFRVTGRGAARPLAFVLDKVAILGVLPDLGRAARILARPGPDDLSAARPRRFPPGPWRRSPSRSRLSACRILPRSSRTLPAPTRPVRPSCWETPG